MCAAHSRRFHVGFDELTTCAMLACPKMTSGERFVSYETIELLGSKVASLLERMGHSCVLDLSSAHKRDFLRSNWMLFHESSSGGEVGFALIDGVDDQDLAPAFQPTLSLCLLIAISSAQSSLSRELEARVGSEHE